MQLLSFPGQLAQRGEDLRLYRQPDARPLNFGPNVSNPDNTGNQFANMLLGEYTSVSQTNGIL